jgi:hypothetical protein
MADGSRYQRDVRLSVITLLELTLGIALKARKDEKAG